MKTPSLSKQLQDILRQEIAKDYAPGDVLPGERRLAQRFQVSAMTIREALQGLVNLGMIERRQGIGTIVLDPGANPGRKNLPVGILVEIDVAHPNVAPDYVALAVTLQRSLVSRGESGRIFFGTLQPGETSVEPTSKELVEALHERYLKALIVISWTTTLWRVFFENAGIPVIRYGNDNPHGVRTDYASFVVDAVEDMVRCGCRHIGLLTWEGARHERMHELSDVFRYQIQRRRLPVNERWIFSGVDPSLVGAGWEGLREIWFADKIHPDGVLISDSVLFRGAVMAAHEMRIRMPEELILCDFSMIPVVYGGEISAINYRISLEGVVANLLDITMERLRNPLAPNRLIAMQPKREGRLPQRSKPPHPEASVPFLTTNNNQP